MATSWPVETLFHISLVPANIDVQQMVSLSKAGRSQSENVAFKAVNVVPLLRESLIRTLTNCPLTICEDCRWNVTFATLGLLLFLGCFRLPSLAF